MEKSNRRIRIEARLGKLKGAGYTKPLIQNIKVKNRLKNKNAKKSRKINRR